MYDMENLPEGIEAKDIVLLERYDRLSKLYAKRAAPLKDKIKAAFGKGNYVIGRVIIKTTVTNNLDTEKFMKAFPADKYPQYYKTVLDVTKVDEARRKGYLKPTLTTKLDVAD